MAFDFGEWVGKLVVVHLNDQSQLIQTSGELVGIDPQGRWLAVRDVSGVTVIYSNSITKVTLAPGQNP